jgi:dTMP kinase
MVDAISGRFITFEGGEGTGKSTQARKLAAALTSENMEVVLTREPGGAPGAEEIRALLVDGAPDKWTPFTETLLHLTARHDHLERTIRPALAAGKWVICDRFLHSTRAYQGYGLNQDLGTIDSLHDIILDGLVPDFTILLDIDAEAGLQRAAGRGDESGTRYEEMELDFHRRVRSGFTEMAAENPDKIKLIDASDDIETIAAAVRDAVSHHFSVEIFSKA